MKKPLSFVLFLLGIIALIGFKPIKADDVTIVGPTVDNNTLTQQEIDDFYSYLVH